jgi:GT2 family glycosyltransferase
LPESTVAYANALSVPAIGSVTESTWNRVSIVMVLHNGLAYTKMCLWTLLSREWHSGDELILVDNASSDGTAAFLRDLTNKHPWIKAVINSRNHGFASANNRGIAEASGDILMLLNADTLMCTGWRERLVRWLMDDSVGMVGPVTNRTCNEAQIDAPYRSFGELERFAAGYTAQHQAEANPISMLAMFCVALRRDVYRQVGPLDERFEIGMFEDDDYARRIRQAGLKLICAEDVFVHHFGQGSFGELCQSRAYDLILEKNRARFEQKWGIAWQPHGRRITPEYSRLRQRIQTITSSRLPAGSTIAVISKGDEELLKLNGHLGWHFPRTEDGAYANIYPADGKEAVSQIQSIRQKGARYLLVPRPSFWWLEHYTELRDHLDAECRLAFKDQDACLIFELSDSHG